MDVTFIIFARKTSGEVFECFRWCRSAEEGIRRAYADAKRFKVNVVDVWAEAV